MKKVKKRVLLIVLAAVLTLFAGTGIYLADYYHADDAALAAMVPLSDGVTVETSGTLTCFLPENPTGAGLIFYPGGKVQCESYAPLLRACAQKGILCVLVHMPGNLAVFDPNAADGIPEQFPQVEHWSLGGHSLGGAMAASYAAGHSGDYEGLILLAAYSTKDLTDSGLSVLSVYGSEDGVLNRDSYEKYRSNLPDDCQEVVLNGGCHAYFGSYGPQKGDGTPSLTNEQQIQATASLIAAFLTVKY